MPLYTSPEHTISARKDTQFIITQYHNSLVEAGFIVLNTSKDKTCDFIVAEGVTFAQELLIPLPHDREGIKNVLKRAYERGLSQSIGGKTHTIPQIIFTLDSQVLTMHQDYCTEWGDVVTKIDMGVVREDFVSNKEMSRNKINNVHILCMTLISRLLAYVISEEHSQRVDHHKLFNAINLFVKKVTGESSYFKQNQRLDLLGLYLTGKHRHSLDYFIQSIECKKELLLHKTTLENMDSFVFNIISIAKKQLIAYWNQNTTPFDLADVNYPRILTRYEQPAFNNEHLMPYSSDNQPNKLVIYFLKQNSKKYHPQLIVLYSLLDELAALQFTILSVKSLLENTGWLSLLGEFMKLSSLSEYLKDFYKKASSILDVTKHEPGLESKSKAYSAVRECGAADLISLNQIPKSLEQSIRTIESKEFQNKIISKIKEDMAKICIAQRALGINIIDPKMVEVFLSEKAIGNNTNVSLS